MGLRYTVHRLVLEVALMSAALTLNAAANCRMEGISSPGAHSPTATRCRICSMIWRYMGRASDCEITN